MTQKKRKIDVVVISDVHLGTYGCHAKELLQYMKRWQRFLHNMVARKGQFF